MRRLAAVAAVLLVAGFPVAATSPAVAHPNAPAARWCADLAAGRGKVLLLGDSIMTSIGASSIDRGWPTMLMNLAPSWHVVPDGPRGSSTAGDYAPGGQYWWITNWARDQWPSVVLMNWRSNEQGLGVSPDSMRASYGAIITELRRVSPNTAIMIVNPPSTNNHPVESWSTYKRAAYVSALQRVRDDHKTLWWDGQVFFPLSGPRATELLPDLVHPGDNGHTAIGVGIHTALLGACDGN